MTNQVSIGWYIASWCNENNRCKCCLQLSWKYFMCNEQTPVETPLLALQQTITGCKKLFDNVMQEGLPSLQSIIIIIQPKNK